MSKPQRKRAPCSFIFYSMSRRDDLKKQYPKKKTGDISKLIGKEWSKLNSAEKQPFVKKYERAKKKIEGGKKPAPKKPPVKKENKKPAPKKPVKKEPKKKVGRPSKK